MININIIQTTLKLLTSHKSYRQTEAWAAALVKRFEMHPVVAFSIAKTACGEIDKANKDVQLTYTLGVAVSKKGERKSGTYTEALTPDSNAQCVIITLVFIDKALKAGINPNDTQWMLRADLTDYVTGLVADKDVATFMLAYDTAVKAADELAAKELAGKAS